MKRIPPFSFKITPDRVLPGPVVRAKSTCVSPGKIIKKPLQKPSDPRTKEEREIELVNFFDIFMDDITKRDFTESLEQNFVKMFHSQKCILWLNDAEKQCLYSKSYKISADYSSSLPGFVFQTKSLIQIRKNASNVPGGYKLDTRVSEVNSPQFFFPLSNTNNVYGVVQLVRRPDSYGFDHVELETAEFCIKKFNVYSNHFFSQMKLSDATLDMFQAGNRCNSPVENVKEFFGCSCVDIFLFDLLRNNIKIFDEDANEMTPLRVENCGIASFCVETRTIVNCENPTKHAAFNKEIDGEVTGPVLCACAEIMPREVWVVCLRGKRNRFITTEDFTLQSMVPFIAKSIIGYNEIKSEASLETRMNELYNVIPAMLGISEINEICKKVEEQVKLLLESEKSIFFLYQRETRTFTSKYMSNKIQTSSSSEGLSGYIFSQREIVNVASPMENASYDPEIDSYPCYENKNTLGLTVLDSRGHALGVVMAIGNPKQAFSKNDEAVLTAYSTYIGLAIERIKLHDCVNEYIAETESIIHNNCEENIRKYVTFAMNCVNCRRITVFSVNEQTGTPVEVISFGIKSATGNKLASICIGTKKKAKYNREKLAEQKIFILPSEVHFVHDKIITQMLNEMSSSKVDMQSVVDSNEVNVITLPTFDDVTGICIGVIEAEFNGCETEELLRVISSIEFVVFKYLKKNSKPETPQEDAETKSKHRANTQKTALGDGMYVLAFDANALTMSDSKKLITCTLETFGMVINVPQDELNNFIDEVLERSGPHYTTIIDAFQGSAMLIKSSRYDAIFGKNNTLALFYSILLRYIDPIESIKILSKYNVTGNSTNSSISNFMKSVIKFHEATAFKRFPKFIESSFSAVESGEFDPTETPEHMFILMCTVINVGACICLVRPFFSEERFQPLYADICKAQDQEFPKSELIQQQILQIYKVLAKQSPSLAHLQRTATNNAQKIK